MPATSQTTPANAITNSEHRDFRLTKETRMTRAMLIAGLSVVATCAAVMPTGAGGKSLKGDIEIDGSSTVFLITQAAAVQFKKSHPDVNITVGISGTGGGFQKFAAGQTDIQDASRKITETEAKKCAAKSITYTELQIGWDGLAVVIHKDNTWASKMTLEQLKKIWHPDVAAKTWKDVDPSWPNERIDLFGPGPASGTFDYFTEVVNGKAGVSRKDYGASEDDNTIVQGVAGNKFAMGYFGVAYYEANKAKLGVVSIASKDGKFVAPDKESVLSRTYPISRPLFLYINNKALGREEVQGFLEFYLRRSDLVSKVGYVELKLLHQSQERKKLEKAIRAVSGK
jgi:phosphate transport system substrate-binding protein